MVAIDILDEKHNDDPAEKLARHRKIIQGKKYLGCVIFGVSFMLVSLVAVTAMYAPGDMAAERGDVDAGKAEKADAFQMLMENVDPSAKSPPFAARRTQSSACRLMGCPTDWCGDGMCDSLCDNAACKYDCGDCGGGPSPTPFPARFPTSYEYDDDNSYYRPPRRTTFSLEIIIAISILGFLLLCGIGACCFRSKSKADWIIERGHPRKRVYAAKPVKELIGTSSFC